MKTQTPFMNDLLEGETCYFCRWERTNMCPKERDFVGVKLENFIDGSGICSRYLIREEESVRRQEDIMNKLHQNLGSFD